MQAFFVDNSESIAAFVTMQQIICAIIPLAMIKPVIGRYVIIMHQKLAPTCIIAHIIILNG